VNSRTAPVSGLQRGVWFLDRLNPGSATYTVPWILEFDDPVDRAFLERGLNVIAERHEVLRTTYSLGRGGPLQTVHEHGRIPFTSNDLSGLPPIGQRAALDEQLDRAACSGFDLASGPLLRAILVTGSAVPTTLILLVHHMVWDGWSAAVFGRELAELYTALAEGRRPALPELSTQYADYALAERDAPYDEQLAYWQERLRGAPARLALPADRDRPTVQAFSGHTAEFALADGTMTEVRKLAIAGEATPFVVQLAAFAVFLSRCTGADDLVIGTPMTTRNRPELTDLIGYFVNIVALRIRVDHGVSFRELVAQVRDTVFDAYANLDVPLDAVIDSLAVHRSPQHPPLVQVLFGAHEEDPAPLRFGSALATQRVHHNDTSKFELTWSTFDNGELRGEVEYSTGLFDPATVLRMIDHWRNLLTTALADPDQLLWRLDSLGEAERATALAGPAAVTRDQPRCLHQMFEDAVDQFPGRQALTFADDTLSYAELDERANRLANALIAVGVQPGDRVGLLLARTAQAVVAILAVLKTGAAYVPVDLAAPDGRAAFVFGDTGVRLVVTDQDERAAAGTWGWFDLREQAEIVGAQPTARPAVPARPADLAYLIFTSGSSGQPKGVAVAHEHVSRLMASGLAHFGFTETDVWTLFHSYAFDWSVWELWGALHHGGRLVVVPYLVSRTPETFVELLAEQRVSCLGLTPSALRQLEAALRSAPRPLPDLRWIMLGGEALDPPLVRRWFELNPRPPATLCNLYGITETTVHVTTHDVAGPADEFQRSLIGGPMPHLTALVLDEWFRPCPVGTPGELFIGGGALAYGYWGRPGLTAERFVPDPFGASSGDRLYRTGDIARRLSDGGLEFLGRCDNQVKIRGFRIELGEVEKALGAYPGVSACVATVHEPSPENRQLAAYITATGSVPRYPELRAFLAGSLPDYMIPASVTVLDVLPVTVNGKVDRAALPVSGAGSVSPATEYVAPGTPAEHLLTEIWTEVLGVPGIGVHDNFFHLGGDSIRAVQLSGPLREHGWSLSLPDLFAAPTPAALAPLLRLCDPATDVAASVPFSGLSERDKSALPGDVVDAYPMVFMQLSMIYHMELSGDAGSYHNVNSYRVSARLDERALRAAVADVMSRHPVLRTSLEVSAYQEPLQLVHAEVRAPVQVADLRGLPESEQEDAVGAVFDASCADRFDLRTAPLFRMTAQRLTDDTFQLTIAEHHSILDGWSFTSLLTEVLERHTALVEDPGCPLAPPPACTFRDFAFAERAAAASVRSEAFWRGRLAGTSGALWSEPGESVPQTAEIPRTVERVLPDAPAQLRTVAEAAGTSVKAVALAAHVLALHRVTGRKQITTGLSVNGRLERPGSGDAYGLFLNTVPLGLDLATVGGTRLDLVRALHEAEAELLPHRRMPFARLAQFMTDTRLESCFAFLRFHSLGRLAGSATRIADDRMACEPTMRYEPTSFALGVALVQDAYSGQALLAVDHLRSLVPRSLADQYVTAYEEALAALARRPDGPLPRQRARTPGARWAP
jgi:amino acid adenylation domain-containing protein